MSRSPRGSRYEVPGVSVKFEPPEQRRAPKHLRGRDIGLWHSRRQRQERQESERRTIGTVLLSDEKRIQLQTYLEKHVPCLYQIDNNSYDHVANSSFKTRFLGVIRGDIDQKLKHTGVKGHDPALDTKLRLELEDKRKNATYISMQAQRTRLPSYNMRNEIIQMIENNQVVIISGETGCGKTTQVAQFILDDYIMSGRGSICKIVCTQPRRISAISVAERVADERAENLGVSVGYHIRLERKMPRDRGSIVFCTTGVILKQMENNVSLDNISHLILDEIHERDVLCDFLIALLAKIVKTRKDLKVVLMSATLNARKFADYYGVDSILEIPGFTFEVKEYYLEDVLLRTKYQFKEKHAPRHKKRSARSKYDQFMKPYITDLERTREYPTSVCNELRKYASEELNMDLVYEMVLHICQTEPDQGAILVFVTGFSDINLLNKIMETSNKFPPYKYLIIPLHSMMPTLEQKYVFRPPPPGVRKIIISTNIAETSITIDDVVFVIDCGRIKMSNYNVETNQQTLMPEWVSVANANQRRGRAGRVKPGICFHLFSKARLQKMESYQKPEILRKRLEDVILMLKLLQLGKAHTFLASVMDPPDPRAVDYSVELLQRLNALDENESLTPLGYHLSRLPVHPQMGKMLLLGAVFSCLDPILSIAASLDFKDPFQMPLGMERQVERKRLELANGVKSDHYVSHEALGIYEHTYNPNGFCREYFLSPQTMRLLMNMKWQFAEYLFDLNFISSKEPKFLQSNLNSTNISLIKAIIGASLYPNVLIARTKIRQSRIVNTALRTVDGGKVKLHPRSILNYADRFESPLLVYYNRVKSTEDFIHDATMIHSLSLLFFGDRFQQHPGDPFIVSVNDSMLFKCTEETANIISELRSRLNWFLEDKASHPGPVNWMNEEETVTLRAILELITIEDRCSDFESVAPYEDEEPSTSR